VLPLGEGAGEPSNDSAILREFVLGDLILVLAFERGRGDLRVREQTNPRSTLNCHGELDDQFAVHETTGREHVLVGENDLVANSFRADILYKKISFALPKYGSSRFVFRFFGSLECARRSRAFCPAIPLNLIFKYENILPKTNQAGIKKFSLFHPKNAIGICPRARGSKKSGRSGESRQSEFSA